MFDRVSGGIADVDGPCAVPVFFEIAISLCLKSAKADMRRMLPRNHQRQ